MVMVILSKTMNYRDHGRIDLINKLTAFIILFSLFFYLSTMSFLVAVNPSVCNRYMYRPLAKPVASQVIR